MTFRTRYDLYRAVFALLPDLLRPQAFIGGGAAVDPDTARDIDLWIRTGEPFVENDMDLLRDQFAALNIRVQPASNIYGDIVPDLSVRRFGEVTLEGTDKPVQIMFVWGDNYPTVESILGSFDISVHQVAVVEEELAGRTDRLISFVRGPEATYPDDAVIITRTGTPDWTLLRYARLTNRYDQNMSYWQVAKLGLTTQKLMELDDRLFVEEGIRIPGHIIANVAVEEDRKNRSAA